MDRGRNCRIQSELRYETMVSTSILLNAATNASAVFLCGDIGAMVEVSSSLSWCHEVSSRPSHPQEQVLTENY